VLRRRMASSEPWVLSFASTWKERVLFVFPAPALSESGLRAVTIGASWRRSEFRFCACRLGDGIVLIAMLESGIGDITGGRSAAAVQLRQMSMPRSMCPRRNSILCSALAKETPRDRSASACCLRSFARRRLSAASRKS
jgi:hypothetical protein